jgi:hypothetical protein
MIDARKFLRSGIGNDAAAFEKDNARRQEQRFAKIVGDEDDGLAETAREGAEFALKLCARDGIERTEGLVHQEDGRIGGEGAGDADALALAAREFVRAAGGEFGGIEANESKEFVDASGSAGSIPFFKGRDERDVLGNGEMGEKACFLNYITDAAAEANGIPFGGGATADDDLACGGNEETIDEFKQRGLAAAAAT